MYCLSQPAAELHDHGVDRHRPQTPQRRVRVWRLNDVAPSAAEELLENASRRQRVLDHENGAPPGVSQEDGHAET
jgi:hypothetical protein